MKKNEKYVHQVMIFYAWELLGIVIKKITNIAFCFNSLKKRKQLQKSATEQHGFQN